MSIFRCVAFVSILTALLVPALVRADVADSAANGFTVKLAIAIEAPPQEVYSRLVRNVGAWWDPTHTFSGDARNLSIDDKPIGCFCEKLPGGGGVRHLEVVYAEPGKRLVFSGGLGPLESMAATGRLTIQLAPAGAGTKLTAIYAVTGYVPAGINAWAPPVDVVLTQQFTRLKKFIENGKAAPK